MIIDSHHIETSMEKSLTQNRKKKASTPSIEGNFNNTELIVKLVRFNHRIDAINEDDYKLFVTKWLTTNTTAPNHLFIINGWQATYSENIWYAELLKKSINTFAFDSRGQGGSPKNGRLDAVENAIDANYIISKEIKNIKKTKNPPGNFIIQGNCIGTMTIATLFAGNFNVINDVSGVLLLSPVTTFDLPFVIKITYFLPKWFSTFSIKYIAPIVLKMIAKDEESEYSRNNAMERLLRLDHDATLRQVKSIFWKEDVKKYWKYVKVPALILVGKNDPLVSYEDSIDPFNRLPYPIWYELDAPDHLLLETNKKIISEIIPEFSKDPWAFYEKHKHMKPKIS